MFTPITIDMGIRIAGVLLTLGLCYQDNYASIWRKTHKKEYKYLVSNWWGYGGPTANFVRWLDDNLWNASKEKVLDEFDHYSTELRCSEKFKNAPCEVQTEAIQHLKNLYDEAIADIEAREQKWQAILARDAQKRRMKEAEEAAQKAKSMKKNKLSKTREKA